MIRRSHEEVVRQGAPAPGRRRTTGGRAITLGILGMVGLLLLTACGPDVAKPYTTLSPESPTADDIHSLYKLVFWLALVVFVGVQFAIVYSALRFRRPNPKSDAPRPPQVHGNSRLEIIWTVIPAVVLLVVLIPTITTLYAADDEIDKGTLEIDIYGKQWWWEVQYGEDKSQGQDLGVITANEIRFPVGRNVVFNLYSNNVIHSFWVPQLSGKLDVVPGHKNQLSITAEKPGTYYGECAEFCGAQHAWMRFTVVAQPEDEFYAWVNGERAGNPAVLYSKDAPPEGVVQAPQAFSLCLSCHTVNGITPYSVTGLDAGTNMGPDLTNLACRESIAAGMLVNNEENRAAWVNDPGGVKPGNYMADQITPGLIRDTYGEEGFNELMDFLTSLQPAGGCDNPGAAATPVASPVASPVSEATPVG